MILSVVMMLRESFQEEELADTIESACYEVMNAILTRDLGGTATTTAFTEAVIATVRVSNYGENAV